MVYMMIIITISEKIFITLPKPMGSQLDGLSLYEKKNLMTHKEENHLSV